MSSPPAIDRIRSALSGFLLLSRGKKRAADDDDDEYEDDDFVVKPKKIHTGAVINGQIGPCAGHEYEEESVSDDSEEEILPDPSDLFDTESEESEPDLINDMIVTDRPRSRCFFVDDEAAESDGHDDDDVFETADEAEESDVSDDQSDSDRDPSIRSPLRKSDFVEHEAVEYNSIVEMYDGMIGSECFSDSQSCGESDDDMGKQHDSDRHLKLEDDDDGDEIVRPKQRRNIVISDSEDEESQVSKISSNKQIPASASDVVVAVAHGEDDADSERIFCPVPVTRKLLSQPLPPNRSLNRKRMRFLKMKQRLKQWIVSDL